MTAPATPMSGPRLCIVSDRARLCAAAGQPLSSAPALLRAQVVAAAAAGVECYQVRERDLEARPLWRLVEQLTTAAGSTLRLLVNDRADVAHATGAGLHLRASSMAAARVRPWLPVGTWLMRSVHDSAEARAAGPVHALVAGAVFATASKPSGHPTLGLDGLAAVVAASSVPVFAIGGVSAANWRAIQATGAIGLAGIGWFLPMRDEDPGDAVMRAVGDAAAVVDSPPEVS